LLPKQYFGYLLLARCNAKCQFKSADTQNPGITSDYLAWITHDIGRKLSVDEHDIFVLGHTIVSDNAFIQNETTSVPIPGKFSGDIQDGYNVYLSQLGQSI
jgi:hypothetical protein